MNHRDTENNEKNMPFQAARFIRYYESIIAMQNTEHGREYWTRGLEAAQSWQRLTEKQNPTREEIENLLADFDRHMKDHGSAGYEMWLYVHAWLTRHESAKSS